MEEAQTDGSGSFSHRSEYKGGTTALQKCWRLGEADLTRKGDRLLEKSRSVQ
jgi:hypothetical protein